MVALRAISKNSVETAWERIKANKGSYGIDEQSIKDFSKELKDNIYKIWNRMSSGTYFPPAVYTKTILAIFFLLAGG